MAVSTLASEEVSRGGAQEAYPPLIAAGFEAFICSRAWETGDNKDTFALAQEHEKHVQKRRRVKVSRTTHKYTSHR